MQKHLHYFLFLAMLLYGTQQLFAQTNCTPSTSPILAIEWMEPGGCGSCNSSVGLFATNGTPPYTYLWNNGIATSGQVINNLCPGTYVVTVTDSNGCTDTEIVAINGSPSSYVIIQQAPADVCACVVLTPYSTGGVSDPITYQWSNGVTTQTNTVCQNGNYMVTVTDGSGCTASTSTFVTVGSCYQTEPATCNLCNGSITMPPDSVNATNPYFIQMPNGTSIQAFAGDVVQNLCAGSYFIYQQAGSQQTITIENLQLPFETNANFTTSAGNGNVINLCVGQPVQLFAPETNLLVSWDFGNGQTSSSLSPTTSYPNIGTFNITLTAQGCDSTASQTITAIVEQGIAPNITCASLVCPGIAETYTTDVVCDTYNWSVVGGSITTGAGTNTITVVWNDVQVGSVSLSVGGTCDGSALCNPVATVNIPIISNNISILGNEVVCANATEVYSVPQYGGVQYNFTVTPSNAGTVLWQQNNQAGILWNSNGTDGTVQVTLSSSLLDCVANNSLPVQVNTPYSISGPTELCGNGTATYTASSGLHNWAVTGNAVIVSGASNSASVVVQGTTGGTFVVSATPVNPNLFCNYPQSLSVTLTDPPLAPQITGEQIICPANSYTYYIAVPVLGYNYHWTVLGGTPTTANGTQITITWNGSGIYQLSATAQSTISPFCQSVAGTLAVDALQSISLSGSNSVCSGDVVSYTVLPNLPNLDYTWAINPPQAGSVVSGQQTANANVQWYAGFAAATLTVSVCNVQSQLAVAIHTAGVPSIVQSNDLCAGSSISLSVVEPYSSYQWTGGSSGSSITVSSGNDYVVTVTDAFGCTNNAVYNLHEYPLPEAAISLSDYAYMCTDNLYNITVAALANPNYNYSWSVNGAAIGTNSNSYLHIATPVANSFTYQTTVTDNHGCVAVSNTETISQVICGSGGCGGSCPNPGAGGGCVPNATDFIGIQAITPYCFTVTFNNLSVGAVSYQWDFGDGSPFATVGNTSAQTHTYAEPGFYTVMIYGTYPNTLASPAFCVYAAYTVVEIPLKADFDFVSPCLNTATEFTDLSRTSLNTTITSWTWNFGDGTPTSSAQNPTHLYSNAGTYNVILVIGDGNCTSTITKAVVVDALPNAAFVLPNLICENSSVSFSPADATNQISWMWDFGDAATVSAQTAEHTYVQDGNYTVGLVVKDAHGCSASSSQTLNTLPVNIENITAPDLSLCEGETALLTAPANTSFEWSTGNSTDNPLAVTAAGTYQVTIVQANGCSYTSPDVVVNFSPLPMAQIQGSSPVMLCPNASTTLTANIGDSYAYSWSTFSNANSVTLNYNTLAPTTTVYVTVTDPNSGCLSVSAPVVVQKVVVDAPSVVAADPQLCEGESTTVTAMHPTLNNFTWSTGTTGSSISANTGGVYWAVVTDANGCSNSGSALVQVNANMDMDLIPIGCYDYCEDDFIEVPDMFDNYQWLLDGVPIAGSTTNQLDPTVSGDYQLIVGNSWGCHDTSEVLTLSLIDCYPCTVTPNFTYLISCGTVQFTPTSTGNGALSHQWDFGDGAALSATPSHSYTQAGTYNVCLTTTNIAIDGDTCTANICQNIIIIDIPNCDDNDCTTADVFNATTCSCEHTPITPPNCDDNDCTTTDTYNAATCTCEHTPITPPNCDDNDCTTADVFNAATCSCEHTPITPPNCDDNDCTTTDSYNAATCTCEHTPSTPPNCDDNDCTTDDVFNATTCTCEHTPITPPNCDDNDCTTTDTYNAATCTCEHTSITPPNCDDNDCTTADVFNTATCTCEHTPITPPNCDDNDCTTDDIFNTATCTCEHTPATTENLNVLVTINAELPIWQGSTITLTATVNGLSGVLSYAWASADGAINCTQTDCSELEVIAMQSDTYSVTVTDQFGCSVVGSLTTEVRIPNRVLIPNAFSPNSDGVNTIFRIAGYNVAEYQLRIYDRWGDIMYDSKMTTDILKGWDGSYNGKDAEMAVYAYYAEVHFTDGTKQILKGNVTLVR